MTSLISFRKLDTKVDGKHKRQALKEPRLSSEERNNRTRVATPGDDNFNA